MNTSKAILRAWDSVGNVLRPLVATIGEIGGEAGKYLAAKVPEEAIERTRLMNSQLDGVGEMQKFLRKNPDSNYRIARYRMDQYQGRQPSLNLTPEEAAINDRLDRTFLWQLEEQIKDGPLIAGERAPQARNGWLPGNISKEVREDIHNPLSENFNLRRQQYVNHLLNMNPQMSTEDALKAFREFQNNAAKANLPDIRGTSYQPLEQPAGYGIPPEWQGNIADTYLRHAMRWSAGMAFHRKIQMDPIAAKALGIKNNGRGRAYDAEQFMYNTGSPELDTGEAVPLLSDLAPVRNLIDHWSVIQAGNVSDAIERFSGLGSALRIGPLSAVRDVVGSFGHVWEKLGVGDIPLVVKSALKNIGPSKGHAMFTGGAHSMHRPADFFTQGEVGNRLIALTDTLRKVSGREAMETYIRRVLYDIGDAKIGQALADNDEKWLNQYVGPLWRKMSPEELRTQGARKFVVEYQGSYGPEDLPAWALPRGRKGAGPGEMFARATFSLARWQMGRFHYWKQNVWQPALKGNLKPLFMSMFGAVLSAEALNWFLETGFGREAPESTWKEIIANGGDDLMYSTFAKFSATGYAGLLSEAGARLTSYSVGRDSLNFRYPADIVATSVIQRTAQAVNALNNGDMGAFETLWRLPLEIMHDNWQVSRAVEGLFRLDAAEKAPGKREFEIYKRTEGRQTISFGAISNPFTVSSQLKSRSPEAMGQKVADYVRRTGKLPIVRGVPMQTSGAQEPFLVFLARLKGSEAEARKLMTERITYNVGLKRRRAEAVAAGFPRKEAW